MEVYILDSLYRRTAIIDRFESLIWTERWQDVGDFELILPSTPVNRAQFVNNVKLGLNESKRVMVVESVEDNTDSEGRTRLKIKGRSIEKILEDRVARGTSSLNLAKRPTWNITNRTPKSVAEHMFRYVCSLGIVDMKDIIPNVVRITSTYPVETIPPNPAIINWDQKPDTLLNATKDVCSSYDLGFRLYRDEPNRRLLYNIYTGNDRTTQQTALAPVVFSPAFETVQNTTKLTTIKEVKNVAYSMNEQGFRKVVAPGVDPEIGGFDRRVLYVNPPKLSMEDAAGEALEPTVPEIEAYLDEQGRAALAEHRALFAFDGEINQRQSPYQYGVHYELGDIVEMRDNDGAGNYMRVTEQIFVHDAEGERSYPTLVIDSYIVTNTWDSFIGNIEWASFGADQYWNNQ